MRLVLPILIFTTGCAQMFLHGGTLVKHDVAAGQPGGYRVVSCNLIEGGGAVPVPNTTYHLIGDGPATHLFERSPNGTGTVLDNQWSAGDGLHYFVWVQRNGWEFIVPTDKAKPPVRLVYTNADELANSDGGVRPTSKPSITCEMAPL